MAVAGRFLASDLLLRRVLATVHPEEIRSHHNFLFEFSKGGFLLLRNCSILLKLRGNEQRHSVSLFTRGKSPKFPMTSNHC